MCIGALQLLCWWLLDQLGWAAWSSSAIVLALGIWLSGGLHHDGLMDTADGLGAGEARRLEAMDDSRVGAGGVLALVMVLLVELAAMAELLPQHPLALLLAPFWARVSPLWAMARFPYLRDQGTAGFHRRHGQPGWDVVPTLVCLPLLLPLGWAGPNVFRYFEVDTVVVLTRCGTNRLNDSVITHFELRSFATTDRNDIWYQTSNMRVGL